MVHTVSRKENRPATANAGRLTRSGERRDSLRFEVEWDAVVKALEADGCSFDVSGRVKNISSTGVCLETGGRLEVGAVIDILIKIPLGDRHWMNYSGEVIRAWRSETGSLVAIRFTTCRPVFL
jgi:hypothetical protein